MIDTHTHLNDPRFDNDREEVRRRAYEAGVPLLVICGYDLSSSKRAIDIASRWGDGSAVGIHPHQATEVSPLSLQSLRELAQFPWVVAVGETGLDYYYHPGDQQNQRTALRGQIRLARELSLPLILHCRQAYQDLIRLLQEEEAEEVGGVVHCFTGDQEEAEQLLDLGFFLGIGGIITFKKSASLRQLISYLPRDRILLETDSPYITPEPFRGRRNEPAYLVEVATVLAHLFHLSLTETEDLLDTNALRCFPKLQKLMAGKVAGVEEKRSD